MATYTRPRIDEVSFFELERRVAYQWIMIYRRKNKETFDKYPPEGVLRAYNSLSGTVVQFWSVFNYYARNMAHGHKLQDLRDSPVEWSGRSLAKSRPRLPRRR